MDSFDQMVMAARPQLWAYAMKLSAKQIEDAEDLLGEAICRAWESFSEYDSCQPFFNWMIRILTNLGTDQLRVKATLPETVSLDRRSKLGELPPDVEDVRAEFSGCFEIFDAIDRLPDFHRVEIEGILEGEGDGSRGERCRRTRARRALARALEMC